MPGTAKQEGDALGAFEPEPTGWQDARLRIDESAHLSNPLFLFLPEQNHVADRDQVRADRVRAEPSETNAQAPSNTGFRLPPLPTVRFDRLPIGRVLVAALSATRGGSVRASQILLISTAAVAIAGGLLGLRACHVGTPAETSGAESAHGSDERPSLPTQVLSANEPGPAVLPGRPFMAALDPVNPTVSIPVAVPTLAPNPPRPADTRQPQVTSRSSLEPPFRGSLVVTSSPEGARVLLNGVLVGVTPLLVTDLPIGSRVVRIELEGHKPWSSSVRIVADAPAKAAAELQPSQVQ